MLLFDFCHLPGGVCDLDFGEEESGGEGGLEGEEKQLPKGWLTKGVMAFFRSPAMGLLMGSLYVMERLCSGSGSDQGDGKDDDMMSVTAIPKVKFGEIITALLDVSTKFRFVIPPYFINNVSVLAAYGMEL